MSPPLPRRLWGRATTRRRRVPPAKSRMRQRRSPASGSQHRDALEGHVIISVTASSAPRRRPLRAASGRGGRSSGSTRPSASRSAPAQAIIAPLSVQRPAAARQALWPVSNASDAGFFGSPDWRRRRRRRRARSAPELLRGRCAARCAAGRRPRPPRPVGRTRRDRPRPDRSSGATSRLRAARGLETRERKVGLGAPRSGRGKAKRSGLPSWRAFDLRSTGIAEPQSFAVLSNASPMASSMVVPSRTYRRRRARRGFGVWPPEARNRR